jgi:hypothetical protein
MDNAGRDELRGLKTRDPRRDVRVADLQGGADEKRPEQIRSFDTIVSADTTKMAPLGEHRSERRNWVRLLGERAPIQPHRVASIQAAALGESGPGGPNLTDRLVEHRFEARHARVDEFISFST